MNKIRILKTVVNKGVLVSTLVSAMISTAHAAWPVWWQDKPWQPLLSVGAGADITSRAGKLQAFPILNPIVDEYYYYTVNNRSQSQGVIDVYLGTEWDLWPDWLLQLGVDYNQPTRFPVSGYYVQGTDALSQDTYFYQYFITTKQLLAEAKLLFSFQQKFHPYVVGGIGASFNNAYRFIPYYPTTLTFTRMYLPHSSSAFSYAIGLGVDYDLFPQIRVGVGYRFTNAGSVRLGQSYIDTSTVFGTLSQSNFYINQVLGQLTFKF